MARFATLAGLLAVVTGCVSVDEKWDERVAGHRWSVIRLQGRRILAGTTITLAFAGGERVEGQAVNRYSARCVRKERTLGVGRIDATRIHRDTPPGAMAQEAHYFSLLRHVTGWRIHQDRLELLGTRYPDPEAELVAAQRLP